MLSGCIFHLACTAARSLRAVASTAWLKDASVAFHALCTSTILTDVLEGRWATYLSNFTFRFEDAAIKILY